MYSYLSDERGGECKEISIFGPKMLGGQDMYLYISLIILYFVLHFL